MDSEHAMPVMTTKRLGGLNVVIGSGPAADASSDGPLVVLLHGYGAPGDDLVPLASALATSPDVRFAFPQAPLSLGLDLPDFAALFGDSRAWWPIEMEQLHSLSMNERALELARNEPPELPAVRQQLIGCLDELQRVLNVPAGRLVLGGFSQGAMLAWDVALHSELELAGLLCFSGAFLAEADWQPRMSSRRGLPALQTHGSDDPVLPRDGAYRLYQAAREAGWGNEWLEFSGGHGIPPVVVDKARLRLGQWLSAAAGPRSPDGPRD